MPNAEKLAKKNLYFDKLINLCVNYPNALIVHADYVGSKQMQDIRMSLRGKAEVLMGKNTMIRRALTNNMEKYPDAGLDKLLEVINGNIGFIFAKNCTLDEIREVCGKFKVSACAKVGSISTCDMAIPAGPTGMDPSQTSFFQCLNVGTKIVKGQIELVSDFPILRVGGKVSASEAALLQKLNIRPFEFGLVVKMVFQDGAVFDAAVLDISPDVLIAKFLNGVGNMAAFGREIGIPTEAGLPHMFGNAFKSVAALVGDIDFTFKEVEEVKKFLKDPTAYAAANGGGGGAAPAAAAAAPAGGKAAAKKAEVVEEEEEEVDFDLFG